MRNELKRMKNLFTDFCNIQFLRNVHFCTQNDNFQFIFSTKSTIARKIKIRNIFRFSSVGIFRAISTTSEGRRSEYPQQGKIPMRQIRHKEIRLVFCLSLLHNSGCFQTKGNFLLGYYSVQLTVNISESQVKKKKHEVRETSILIATLELQTIVGKCQLGLGYKN